MPLKPVCSSCVQGLAFPDYFFNQAAADGVCEVCLHQASPIFLLSLPEDGMLDLRARRGSMGQQLHPGHHPAAAPPPEAFCPPGASPEETFYLHRITGSNRAYIFTVFAAAWSDKLIEHARHIIMRESLSLCEASLPKDILIGVVNFFLGGSMMPVVHWLRRFHAQDPEDLVKYMFEGCPYLQFSYGGLTFRIYPMTVETCPSQL